jgi:hypothetical protein
LMEGAREGGEAGIPNWGCCMVWNQRVTGIPKVTDVPSLGSYPRDMASY